MRTQKIKYKEDRGSDEGHQYFHKPAEDRAAVMFCLWIPAYAIIHFQSLLTSKKALPHSIIHGFSWLSSPKEVFCLFVFGFF